MYKKLIFILLELMLPIYFLLGQTHLGTRSTALVNNNNIESIYKKAYQYDLDGYNDSGKYFAKFCIVLAKKANYSKEELEGQNKQFVFFTDNIYNTSLKKNQLSRINLAYTLYKASNNHNWLSPFKESVLHMHDHILRNQGENKIPEIFSSDENFAKADYIIVKERLHTKESELALDKKHFGYLIVFSLIAILFIVFLWTIYLKNRLLVKKLTDVNKELEHNNNHLLLYDRAITLDLLRPMSFINECAQLLKNQDALEKNLKDLTIITIIAESDNAIKQIKNLLKIGMEGHYSYISDTKLYCKLLDDAVVSAKLSKANIQVKCINSLPLIYMDQSGLQEIFKIILKNGKDHAGMGDNLKINIQGRYKIGDKHCYIDISDNGKGIETDDIKSLFDIKLSVDKNKNTGFGLAICYVILKKYRGTITCTSNLNGGATFTLGFLVDNTSLLKKNNYKYSL